jgi:hypothetical protein
MGHDLISLNRCLHFICSYLPASTHNHGLAPTLPRMPHIVGPEVELETLLHFNSIMDSDR